MREEKKKKKKTLLPSHGIKTSLVKESHSVWNVASHFFFFFFIFVVNKQDFIASNYIV